MESELRRILKNYQNKNYKGYYYINYKNYQFKQILEIVRKEKTIAYARCFRTGYRFPSKINQPLNEREKMKTLKEV